MGIAGGWGMTCTFGKGAVGGSVSLGRGSNSCPPARPAPIPSTSKTSTGRIRHLGKREKRNRLSYFDKLGRHCERCRNKRERRTAPRSGTIVPDGRNGSKQSQ